MYPIVSSKPHLANRNDEKVWAANEQYIYILTYVLFLDKLRVKCESFKAIE